jgi:FkbM family methyltransferase
MKFEQKLKEKYLYSKNNNLFKRLYFFLENFRTRKLVRNYTVVGIDLLLNLFFRSTKIKRGIYIDVGCNHPIFNNSTHILFKNGWSGINIDLDFHFIDLFNYFRPNDFNKQIACSDSEGEKELYFYHNKSALNTLSKKAYELRTAKIEQVKKVNTTTLNNIIENSKYKNNKINFLSIDVEGHEMNVLRGFDIVKYSPEIVVVEYIDLSMKKEEFYNNNISTVLESEISRYMKFHDYSFVNWFNQDLVYVNNKLRNN